MTPENVVFIYLLPLPLATCLSWVGPPSNLGGRQSTKFADWRRYLGCGGSRAAIKKGAAMSCGNKFDEGSIQEGT